MVNQVRGEFTALIDYRALLQEKELKDSVFSLESVMGLSIYWHGAVYGWFPWRDPLALYLCVVFTVECGVA